MVLLHGWIQSYPSALFVEDQLRAEAAEWPGQLKNPHIMGFTSMDLQALDI